MKELQRVVRCHTAQLESAGPPPIGKQRTPTQTPVPPSVHPLGVRRIPRPNPPHQRASRPPVTARTTLSMQKRVHGAGMLLDCPFQPWPATVGRVGTGHSRGDTARMPGIMRDRYVASAPCPSRSKPPKYYPPCTHYQFYCAPLFSTTHTRKHTSQCSLPAAPKVRAPCPAHATRPRHGVGRMVCMT